MDEQSYSVASAVVLPSHEDSLDRPKRRQLSPETIEGSKRARLSPSDHSEPAGLNDSAQNTVDIRSSNLDGDPPLTRRRLRVEEERVRSKRLFGALLGTIGKFQKETSSYRARSSAVKRREVEAKLEEKLKQQTEELDVQRKKDSDTLNFKKKIEKRKFEERAMEIRHCSILAQANMLATTAAPKLFYLPWKLLPSEDDSITAQVESSLAAVEMERREFGEMRLKDLQHVQLCASPLNPEHRNDGLDRNYPQKEFNISETNDLEVLQSEKVDTKSHPHKGDHSGVLEIPPFVPGRPVLLIGNSDMGRRSTDFADIADVDEGVEDTVIY